LWVCKKHGNHAGTVFAGGMKRHFIILSRVPSVHIESVAAPEKVSHFFVTSVAGSIVEPLIFGPHPILRGSEGFCCYCDFWLDSRLGLLVGLCDAGRNGG